MHIKASLAGWIQLGHQRSNTGFRVGKLLRFGFPAGGNSVRGFRHVHTNEDLFCSGSQ